MSAIEEIIKQAAEASKGGKRAVEQVGYHAVRSYVGITIENLTSSTPRWYVKWGKSYQRVSRGARTKGGEEFVPVRAHA